MGSCLHQTTETSLRQFHRWLQWISLFSGKALHSIVDQQFPQLKKQHQHGVIHTHECALWDPHSITSPATITSYATRPCVCVTLCSKEQNDVTLNDTKRTNEQGACGHHTNACQRSYVWWWKPRLITLVYLHSSKKSDHTSSLFHSNPSGCLGDSRCNCLSNTCFRLLALPLVITSPANSTHVNHMATGSHQTSVCFQLVSGSEYLCFDWCSVFGYCLFYGVWALSLLSLVLRWLCCPFVFVKAMVWIASLQVLEYYARDFDPDEKTI